MPDYNLPDLEYGGGRPASYKAADGTRFWGTLAKRDGVLRLVVVRTAGDGALLSTWEPGILGQGGLVLQGDGTLEAVGYVGYGDGSTIRAVAVPGWVPWPTIGPRGPQGVPGPQGPAGPAATLSARYQAAIDRLCQFLGL